MIIFENNDFGNDTLSLRTSRLQAVETNIQPLQSTLSMPQVMVDMGLASRTNWQNALTKSHVEMAGANIAYQSMHDADKLTFEYYLKCKSLVIDLHGNDSMKLRIYGVETAFPRTRKGKLKSVQDLIDGNAALVAQSEPKVLPPAFINQLQTCLNVSNNAFKTLILTEKQQAMTAVDEQNALFDQQTEGLRVMYSWARMSWSKYEPQLLLLGFAPAVRRKGSGQPDAPENLTYINQEGNSLFSWSPCDRATSYQLAYSPDGEEWEEAYNGQQTTVQFNPGAGNWIFRVRARNAHGFGDWSAELPVSI